MTQVEKEAQESREKKKRQEESDRNAEIQRQQQDTAIIATIIAVTALF